jgi:transposase
MYLRTTARKNQDGSVVRYLALAHNQRVGAATKANVLLNLGREDRLDPDGLRRLVRSINRYLGEPDAEGTDALATTGADHASDTTVDHAAEGLRLIASRPAGAAWLLDGLWKALGVDAALRAVLGGRRFSTDVERVLFALVANRAIDPASKLAAADWASHDVAVPGLDGMDEDQAYRAMDLLIAADTDAKVQEAVFFAVADLLNLEVDLLFFDTTSTYFERDTEDPDPADGDAHGGFRRYGYSKDHRRDLPQIVIGLAVTREGIPVRCWCWPGNTNDQAILPEVRDGLRGWRLGRVVTVVDRGFSSKENLAYLQRAGGHYIAGERMRDGSPHAAEALSRQGRYQQVRDNLRVKEVRIDATPGIRWILCHNPDEAERDQAARSAAITRIAAELDRISTARARTREQARARRIATTMTPATRRRAEQQAERDEAAHVKAECALREHPALGRWLRQTPAGRLQLDRAKITAEARLDGKYLLSTSDPDLSAEDVALGYKNLLEAERGFRDLKSTIELRPVFHRLEPRIRAHVLLCWLALLLIRVAERRTGQTWRQINRELGRLHAITLVGPAGTVVQTTEPTAAQSSILRACGLTPPPRITTLDPA